MQVFHFSYPALATLYILAISVLSSTVLPSYNIHGKIDAPSDEHDTD